MTGSMFNLPRRSAWLFLICAIILLFAFGGASGQPAIGDECRVAGIAMEMAQDGKILLPRLNGSPFPEYPPLYYWCVAPWLKIFGGNAWSVHAASLLIAGLMGVSLFGFARTLELMPGTALFAAMILLTNGTFLGASLLCRVDILLALFALIGWWGGALCWVAAKNRSKAGFWLLTAGLAGAFLTKNLAGGAIIISGLGAYLIFADLLERQFRFRRYLLFAGAFLLALVPYLLYLWSLKQDAGWKAVEDMAIYNNFGRFAGSRGEHAKPVWFYLVKLPEQFQPWLILLLAAIICGLRKIKSISPRWLYPVTLLAVPFLLLSLSSGKRQVYLLPLVTPAALFTGMWIDSSLRLRRDLLKGKNSGKWLLLGWRILLISAMTAALALPVCARICRVGCLRFELGSAGVLLFGILLLRQGKNPRLAFQTPGEQVARTWVLLTFSIGVSMGSIRAIQLRHNVYDPMFQQLEERFPQRKLFLYSPAERLSGAAYYYRRTRTPEIPRNPQLLSTLPADAILLTSTSLAEKLPADQWEIVPAPKWTKVNLVVRRSGNVPEASGQRTPAGSFK